MKYHTDVRYFIRLFAPERHKQHFMADEKSPARISHRPVAYTLRNGERYDTDI